MNKKLKLIALLLLLLPTYGHAYSQDLRTLTVFSMLLILIRHLLECSSSHSVGIEMLPNHALPVQWSTNALRSAANCSVSCTANISAKFPTVWIYEIAGPQDTIELLPDRTFLREYACSMTRHLLTSGWLHSNDLISKCLRKHIACPSAILFVTYCLPQTPMQTLRHVSSAFRRTICALLLALRGVVPVHLVDAATFWAL
jgi:hypothetical protein